MVISKLLVQNSTEYFKNGLWVFICPQKLQLIIKFLIIEDMSICNYVYVLFLCVPSFIGTVTYVVIKCFVGVS